MSEKLHQIIISNYETKHLALPSLADSNYLGPLEYRLWDLESVTLFIREHFDQEVQAAFENLRPFAFKADLARYCILYQLGGWYADLNIGLISPLPNARNFDLCVIRDFNNHNQVAPYQLANGLVYAKVGSPQLKLAISKVVKNSQKANYGLSPLSPTGPELFGQAVAEVGISEGAKLLVGDFVYEGRHNRKEFRFGSRTVAVHKNLPGGVTGIPGTNNYVEMWKSHEVFKNQPSESYKFSVHTDNPVDGVEHFGYALAFHKILESIGSIELDGNPIEAKRNDSSAKIQLFMGSNPGQFYPGQYKIQMTQWESTIAPASWPEFAKAYDEFWTANPFGAEAIVRAGVPESKVHVYEHGIDSETWPRKMRGQNEIVRFLHVDSDNPRKRSDLAVKAFKAAFGDDPKYQLTLKYSLKKTKYFDTFPESIVDWNQSEVLESHGRWDGNVRHIEEIVTSADMVAIYHHHDVLVYPSEGEGFGFIPLQALATGMPTICTGRWPSYEKYLLGNVIDSNLGPSTFMEHYPGDCVIPIEESLITLMRSVASEIQTQSKLFFDQAPEVAREYSWENKTKPVLEELFRRVGRKTFSGSLLGGDELRLFEDQLESNVKYPSVFYSKTAKALLKNFYFFVYKLAVFPNSRGKLEVIAQKYFASERTS